MESRKNTKNSRGKPIQKLTMYKIRHPKTDINKLYVEGKRGLLKTEATYNVRITNTAECLNTKC